VRPPRSPSGAASQDPARHCTEAPGAGRCLHGRSRCGVGPPSGFARAGQQPPTGQATAIRTADRDTDRPAPHQLHTPEGKVFPQFLRLVVRPDGTGTYDINDARGGPAYATWPVSYVGGAPGRVTLKRHSRVCGKDDTELSLEFTVGPKAVTITRAVTGGCSPVTIVGVDLRGVVLRLSPSAPGDRTSVGDGSF
jgi:hypothetical protein